MRTGLEPLGEFCIASVTGRSFYPVLPKGRSGTQLSGTAGIGGYLCGGL